MPFSPTDGYLPPEEVRKRYRRSHKWLYRLRGLDKRKPHLADPNFPKPRMTVHGRAYWSLQDLEAWEKRNATTQ
jgi:hypothetical protein